MRAGRRADCSCERTPALQAGRERGNHRTLCSIRKKPPRPGRADSMLRSAARRLLLGACSALQAMLRDAPRRWKQPAPQTSRHHTAALALARSKTTHPPHPVQHHGESSSPRARRFQVTGRSSLRTLRRKTPRPPTHRWQVPRDYPRAGRCADCSWKRALRTQFGRSNKTPAAPCAASGGKLPAPGAPIPSYERFSPPEAARAADKYLLHSRRGLGRAAGVTSKICLSDARVSQSRHRFSSGENSPQPDQTARGSS